MTTIFNFQFSIFNLRKGFTLVELLVVMALLLAVGTIIGVILFSSLRGANKTNVLTVVRQNGNYAISQITKTIRSTKTFNGVSNNGVDYTQICPVTPTRYTFLKITSLDGIQTTFNFACASSPATIFSNDVSLLDTAAVSLVSTAECSFTCSQASQTDIPTIGIRFSLKEYQPSGTTFFPEKTATVTFQTSVTLRNIFR